MNRQQRRRQTGVGQRRAQVDLDGAANRVERQYAALLRKPRKIASGKPSSVNGIVVSVIFSLAR
jgi:hypothetical protein